MKLSAGKVYMSGILSDQAADRIDSALKIITTILKAILGKVNKVKMATNSYIDYILLD